MATKKTKKAKTKKVTPACSVAGRNLKVYGSSSAGKSLKSCDKKKK
jgi:hypothetical protein